MSREVKRFMEESGYTGALSLHGVRKMNKRRTDWDFKPLKTVLNDYRLWKQKENR